jgi:hypothetical protein
MREDAVMKVVREGLSKNIELLKNSIQEANDPEERERFEERLKQFERLAEQVAERR